MARPASLQDSKGKTSVCHVAGRAQGGAHRGPVGLLQTRTLAPTPVEAGSEVSVDYKVFTRCFLFIWLRNQICGI